MPFSTNFLIVLAVKQGWVFLIQITMIFYFNKSVHIFKSLFYHGKNDHMRRRKLDVFRYFMSLFLVLRAIYYLYLYVIQPLIRDRCSSGGGETKPSLVKLFYITTYIFSWIPIIFGCTINYVIQKVAKDMHLIIIMN